MAKRWTAEEILGMARGFQPAAVLFAAAELDVFSALKARPMGAPELAGAIGGDLRATRILLDALAAMGLLEKHDEEYRLPSSSAELLAGDAPHGVLGMILHQANCSRSWARLAEVVKTGQPTQRAPSVRGEAADQAAFIDAMHVVSRPLADELIAQLQPLRFNHLLDVGGGPGTWTIAFLRAAPQAAATLFDLPDVVPMARRRIADAGLADRVKIVGGDFHKDPLPAGADLAWVSAIVHMNSRRENRALFEKVRAALVDGGQILIRDVVMDSARTRPAGGAMFAVNMLVHTAGGGTYTFAELAEDLGAAGFAEAALLRQGEFMDSIVRAVRVE